MKVIFRKKRLFIFWVAVVIVWGILMGSLIKRENWIPSIPRSGDLIAGWDRIGEAPVESWMSIQFQGKIHRILLLATREEFEMG